jgi:adenylate cyclase
MAGHAPPDAPPAAALPVIEWLIEAGIGVPTLDDVVAGLGARLRGEGVALDRLQLAHNTLHPKVRSSAHYWSPGGGAGREDYPHSGAVSRAWAESPMRAAVEARMRRMRRRLTGADALLDFPVLAELRDEGFTDYFLCTQGYNGFYRPPEAGQAGLIPDVSGLAVSYATRRGTGFSDRETAILEAVLDPLAALVKIVSQGEIARTIAASYIGPRAGELVLGGAIRLGDVDAAEAVIWFSDMRGSTALAERLSPEAYVATVNAFFEATIGAVVAEGGEPLTLMGDGALAIFPVAEMGAEGARAAAIHAARSAAEATARLNADRAAAGEAPIGHGVALHAGSVQYGNVGVSGHQRWTVLGPAVNTAARLEGLTKTLGEPVLASAAFAGALVPAWRALGAHGLRGVPAPIEVLAPPEPGLLGGARAPI